jgi:hypothetical protein
MRRVIETTMASAQKIYRQAKTQNAQGKIEMLPEVVVRDLKLVLPDHETKIMTFINDKKTNDQKAKEKLGFHYFPNVISNEESIAIQNDVQQYLDLFGATVEENHFIQRDNRPLSTGLSFLVDLVVKLLHPRITVSDVFPRPSFNIYPPFEKEEKQSKSNELIKSHQDPLFSAQQVAIVSLGSPLTINFRHWVSGHSFSQIVESNSIYMMSGLCRYEYVHGSTCASHQGRLSLVIPVKVGDSGIESIVGQIWGQSDQREEMDRWYNASCVKFHPNFKPKPLNLLQYLNLLACQVALKNLSQEDYEILNPTIQRLKKMCRDEFGYKDSM